MDNKRRRILGYGTAFAAGVGTGYVLVPLVRSLQPAEPEQPVADDNSIDVDISRLLEGHIMTVSWLLPVSIIRRSPEQVAGLREIEGFLYDPHSEKSTQPDYCWNYHRSLYPEIFIAVNHCPHLGCALNFQPQYVERLHDSEYWKGGFDCPCHSSYFDLAGRVYKQMPAKDNLMVPPYTFTSDTVVRIGVLDEPVDSSPGD